MIQGCVVMPHPMDCEDVAATATESPSNNNNKKRIAAKEEEECYYHDCRQVL
ncbi:MAG: hypothetical protein ACREOZ_02545 [Gloeomargaritales cyanobacterium]